MGLQLFVCDDIAFEELSPEEFREQTAGRWPPAAVDMLPAAWQATLGHRAYVTSWVADVIGSPARTFDRWAADHTAAFGDEAAGVPGPLH